MDLRDGGDFSSDIRGYKRAEMLEKVPVVRLILSLLMYGTKQRRYGKYAGSLLRKPIHSMIISIPLEVFGIFK